MTKDEALKKIATVNAMDFEYRAWAREALANDALEKKAENARELGLDYEPEPVAFINVEQRKLEWAKYMTWDTPTVVNLPKIPLYTTPPQRKPLTDEQIFVIKHNWITTPFVNHLDFARAIEAAHGIAGEKPNAA